MLVITTIFEGRHFHTLKNCEKAGKFVICLMCIWHCSEWLPRHPDLKSSRVLNKKSLSVVRGFVRFLWLSELSVAKFNFSLNLLFLRLVVWLILYFDYQPTIDSCSSCGFQGAQTKQVAFVTTKDSEGALMFYWVVTLLNINTVMSYIWGCLAEIVVLKALILTINFYFWIFMIWLGGLYF